MLKQEAIRLEFEQFLRDASGGSVTILFHTFDPVEALKKLDPDAFDSLFEAWLEIQSKPNLKLVDNPAA